jgi:hypothetical protein
VDEVELLTDASRRSGAGMLLQRVDRTASNVRTIPYAERYRQVSGLFETPAEHLQRAADEDDD